MPRPVLDTHAVGVKTPSTRNIMLWVLIALLPGVLSYAWLISSLVFFNIVFAVVFAIMVEAVALKLRSEDLARGISDGSIALAAALLALAIPPMLPFWQLLIGIVVMVLLGKHVYGGLGNNPFNPAMVGYAALLVSFPQNMTLWLAPELLQQLELSHLLSTKLSFQNLTSNPAINWDGITRATPLEHARTMQLQQLSVTADTLHQRALNSGWLWVNAGFLLGGLFLLQRRIIQWHIPVSVLVSFTVCTWLFSTSSLPLHISLFSGALMLGAFFIATDPVTTASSQRARLVFGFGVGVLSFVIREYGGYPEGLAFAILLMNLCVPLIDHLDIQLAKPS